MTVLNQTVRDLVYTDLTDLSREIISAALEDDPGGIVWDIANQTEVTRNRRIYLDETFLAWDRAVWFCDAHRAVAARSLAMWLGRVPSLTEGRYCYARLTDDGHVTVTRCTLHRTDSDQTAVSYVQEVDIADLIASTEGGWFAPDEQIEPDYEVQQSYGYDRTVSFS